MARKYKRRSVKLTQKRYRSRLTKYYKYLSRTHDETPKSFKEWNKPYRLEQFYKREYKLYNDRFDKRKESSVMGFRKTGDDYNLDVEAYDYDVFKEQYILTRNTLEDEVESGERERIGSVINEMVNDQAYELSRVKAYALASYLKENELPFLKEKGLIKDTFVDEKGNTQYVFKEKKLELLIRQGQFIREEVGLWDAIKNYYQTLRDNNYSSAEAKAEIGQTFFRSPK